MENLAASISLLVLQCIYAKYQAEPTKKKNLFSLFYPFYLFGSEMIQ